MLQGQVTEGSTVIAFRPMPRRPNRTLRRDEAERGTLLLFTGVRYERPTEWPAPAESIPQHESRRERS